MELSLDINTNQLVQQCVEGNTSSYRLLYEQYVDAMYNTALRIVNHTAEAEDIVQESFSDAFQTLHLFRKESSFGAWLKRIVVNKSINAIKREKKKWVEVDIASIEGYTTDEPEIDESDFVYQVESILKAMQCLPDGYRTVLSLHLVEQYRQEEIAKMLGISHATVRTQYLRAKKKLLEILQQNMAR